jgi:uncharacterized membrane protein HdeD (DUF308 family)
MTNSKQIAGLVGPTLIAVTITEYMNLDMFIASIGPAYGPHVYLNGMLLFVAGLAIVRAHNLWTRHWPVLITVLGWFLLLLGLLRMAAPMAAQQAAQTPTVLYGSLVGLLAIGIFLTFKGIARGEG